MAVIHSSRAATPMGKVAHIQGWTTFHAQRRLRRWAAVLAPSKVSV